MLKRLDRLDVATTDLDDAARVYQSNFGFRLIQAPDGESAVLAVGNAQIRLATGASVEAVLKQTGEGMVALWLEAEDVEQVAAAMRRAGIDAGPVHKEGDRRVLAVDHRQANQVPLFIFDRKG
jgi:predicted enzyme related to lactoylglutathione lyase